MTFQPKHLPFQEALRVVADRQKIAKDQVNPLILALREKALHAEVRADGGEWKRAETLLAVWFPNPLIGSYQAPGPGEIAHTDVRIATADIDSLWPIVPTKDKQPSKGAGGAPPKWDWEGAFIEMARIAILDDDTVDRATMNKKIAQWFVNATGEAPADSVIREKIKRFYAEVWPRGH